MSTPNRSSVIPETPTNSTSTGTDTTQASTSSTGFKGTLKRNSSSSSSSRPRLGPRASSGSMIVPSDHPDIEIKSEIYGADDARSFSPRRSSEETEKMVGESRSILQSRATELQSGLDAIVEKVELVKNDHDKLERNNTALQDYIGGLTQSMSRTNLATGGGGSGRTDTQLPIAHQTIFEEDEEDDDGNGGEQRGRRNGNQTKSCDLCETLEEVHPPRRC